MDKYLDLQEYLGVIIKRRLFIGAVFVVAVVAATVFSFLVTPAYEASTMVAVTKPTYQFNFDPRFSTLPPEIQSIMSLQGFDAFLRNSDLRRRVIHDTGLAAEGDEFELMDALDKMVKVSAVGSGTNLYEIKITAGEPDKAARIANRWGELFASQMNEVFGPGAGPQGFLEKQLQAADETLKRTEAAYIEFQGTSQILLLTKKIEAKAGILASYVSTRESGRSTVLGQEVSAKTSALSTYLTAKNNIRLVMQDAQKLKEQLTLSGEASNATVNNLSALLLEISSLNANPKLPIQLQIPLEEKAIAAATPSQRIRSLDGLMTVLRAKEQTASEEVERISSELINLKGLDFLSTVPPANDPVATQIGETTSEILYLSGELARQQVQADRLALASATAKSTYQTLYTKLDEAKVAAGTLGPVRVVSQAIEPRWPVSPKKRTNIVVGALLGLFAGVAGSFIWEYVLRPSPKEPA